MLDKLRQHIAQNLTFLDDKTLLVACSGGLDSIVLSHLLIALGYSIGLAHCNFALRGKESDEDEAFVDDTAKNWEVPFFSERFDTEAYTAQHKVSTQMAARTLRYDWFDTILKEFNYDYLLTAHHADDNLETFFINLLRGTGLNGLTGIPELNENIVRPLLPFSREEILKYAKSNNLFWREDSSNVKTDYLRNQLRHDVIPKYKEASGNALSNFRKTQKHLSGSRALIDDYLTLVYNLVVTTTKDGYEIDIPKLEELPNKEELLYEFLSLYGFTAWNDVVGLLDAQSGKQVFSSTHRLVKDREVLILSELPVEAQQKVFYITADTRELNEPIVLKMDPASHFEITNANTVFVDTDRLKYPLVLRKWQEGDVFQPFGMKGKKKLSKFFKDEKLSLIAKENCWVLCSDEEIVWVVGMRLDDRFKVTRDTENLIRMEYIPN